MVRLLFNIHPSFKFSQLRFFSVTCCWSVYFRIPPFGFCVPLSHPHSSIAMFESILTGSCPQVKYFFIFNNCGDASRR